MKRVAGKALARNREDWKGKTREVKSLPGNLSFSSFLYAF